MLNARVIRDLCRFPKWLVGDLVFAADQSLSATGWALAYHGDLTIGEITLNNETPDAFQRTTAHTVANLFHWDDNAELAGFRATFRNVVPDAQGYLRFSYRGRWTQDPFNRWQDIHFPLKAWRDRSLVEPDAPRMVRTQGSGNFLAYVMYGATVARMLDEAAQTYFGKSIADFENICDWGCGCGRLIQAVHQVAPHANLTGIDIDRDNIDWCRRNLGYAEFVDVPLFPPTEFADGQFDLLFGISVFTHLTRKAFEAWRDEIHRIVRPGGVILVTVNRGASLVRLGSEALMERTIESGFDDAGHDPALKGKIEDDGYYRGTYLMTREVRRIFGDRFRIRDILPQASGTSQDLVVCERL